MRDRDLLAVQDGGVHRHALRLHHCARDAGTRRHELKPHVAAPPDHHDTTCTAYIVQRAAEAVFTDEGYAQCMENLDYYRRNARIMADTLDRLGIFYTGGVNSPYIWLRCPGSMKSWDFFDLLLERAQVVGTPGAGFGVNGEGFFRPTAFGQYENTVEAMRRFEALARSL